MFNSNSGRIDTTVNVTCNCAVVGVRGVGRWVQGVSAGGGTRREPSADNDGDKELTARGA